MLVLWETFRVARSQINDSFPTSFNNTHRYELVNNSCIRFSSVVKLLGINLDCCLTFDDHVKMLVSECFYHLWNIAKIKRYLFDTDAQKLIHAFISSKLDYSNAVLFGIKSSSLAKLQKVQNYAARLAVGSSQTPISTVLENLHWLNINQRIVFKLLLLTHKFFIGISPFYFCDLLLIKRQWTTAAC